MWFAASLLYKSSRRLDRDGESPWEETIILVRAPDEAQARIEAEKIGRAQEHEYLAPDGDTARWTFDRVERVYTILADTLSSGTEVFSRFLRPSEVQSLLTSWQD